MKRVLLKKERLLALKQVKLPKDPMMTDEDSDVSSTAAKRKEIEERLAKMPKLDYKIPQNGAPVVGENFFVDQMANAQVYDLDRQKSDGYSPTGNSWKQSDIDDEYHQFDPARYPPSAKKLGQLKIQDESEMSIGRSTAQQGSMYTNEVTTFGDLVERRFKEQQLLKIPNIHNRASSKQQSSGGRAPQSSSRQMPGRKPQTSRQGPLGSDLNEIMTNQERIAFEKSKIPSGVRNQAVRNKTLQPSITVDEVGTDRNYTTSYLEASQLESGALNTKLGFKHHTQDMTPRIHRDYHQPSSPSFRMTEFTIKEEDQSPFVHRDSTIQIQGNQIKNLQKSSMHQESNFSFNLGQSPKYQPPKPKQRRPTPEPQEGTPERILREFTEKARAYKLNFATNIHSQGRKVQQSWRDLMRECKDEWELRTKDLYNPSPQVLYDAYVINLSHTVAAKLSQIAGRNIRVNLRQGKPFKKIQINVTTVHQTKFQLTKFGNGFGYGTTDKLSPEDLFLKSVFDKASQDAFKKRRAAENRETLAALVPQIIKKPPKVVTDSLQALHLSCRRGIPIDKNGMPFLVEIDRQSRKNYLAYLKKNGQQPTLNQTSSKSIRSSSLKKKENIYLGMLLGDQENESTSQLSKITEHVRSKTHVKPIYTLQPFESKGRHWIKQVEILIDKFDQSFRQNELQQLQIREAQEKLQIAKDKILGELNNEQIKGSSEQFNYASDESYKKDSCAAFSDDDQQSAKHIASFRQAPDSQNDIDSDNDQVEKRLAEMEQTMRETSMMRTFQTNYDRESYKQNLDNLHEKYSFINSLASDALSNKWDTRKELQKISSQPQDNSKVSLAASKKSFKRNRDKDNHILNERSGDLLSHNPSQIMSPQELFNHFERINHQKEAKLIKMSPHQRSLAEKLSKQSQPNLQFSIGNVLNSQSNDLKAGIKKDEQNIQNSTSQPHSNQDTHDHSAGFEKALIRNPPNLKFDINEAKNRQTEEMNKSIMSQLQSQQPFAILPKKIKSKFNQNKDIEAFISSPTKRAHISSKMNIGRIGERQFQNDAYQTLSRFQKTPELLKTAQLPNLNSTKQNSGKKTMHMTMTDLNTPFSSGLRGDFNQEAPSLILDQNDGSNPANTTTNFGSIDQDFKVNLRALTNQLGSFNGVNKKMQIVDEADETQSIIRPSFFDAMKMKIKVRQQATTRSPKFAKITQSTINNESVYQSSKKKDSPQNSKLTRSLSPTHKLSIQALKEQQQSQIQKPPKKPSVPSFSLPPRSNIVTTKGAALGKTSGFSSARGPNQVISLKPINLTGLTKFKAPYQSYRNSKVDTGLTKNQRLRKASVNNVIEPSSVQGVSPFQMMLEEMKKIDRSEEEVARPTVQQIEDFLDYKAGEMTVEDSPKNEQHFLAYEDRLEQIMNQTNSVDFNSIIGDMNGMGQTVFSDMYGSTQYNFAKKPEEDKNQTKKSPYFKNEAPLKDTYTKLLEKKFRETENVFKEEAQRLIEGVRIMEQIKNGGDPRNQTISTHQSNLQSTWKTRNRSLNPIASGNEKSIKEQLRDLKLSEANPNEKTVNNIQRRRRSEINKLLSQTGTGFDSRRQDLGQSQYTPRVEAQQTFDQTMTSLAKLSMYEPSTLNPFQNNAKQEKVSFTFKKFKLASQQEHTKYILPSVAKQINMK